MRRSLSLLALLAAVVAGCGDAKSEHRAAATPTTPTGPTGAIDPLALPQGVPTASTGPADADAERVIRGWSAALAHGDVERAADYFAQPSRIQNATPVIALRSRADRLGFNGSLSCGSVPTKFAGAGRFTIVSFRLIERPGGSCGGGVGASARCAIRVSAGHIAEWYRLPEQQAAPPADPASDNSSGPAV